MNKQLSIDEILDGLWCHGNSSDSTTDLWEDETRLNSVQAKQALLEYMESKAPELRLGAMKPGEVIVFDSSDRVELHWLRKAQDAGFNEAIKQYKSNLRGGK